MNKPLISVIVTAFNEGTNIRKCLSSLVTQKSNNFEVIVVDDGSNRNDPSIKIMNSYSLKFSNIRVIHQSNKGSISARLKEIKNAFADYLTFVDADDFVSNNYVNSIINIINKKQADLYLLNKYLNKSGSLKFYIEKDFLDNNACLDVSTLCEWILTGKAGAVWDKIYKRSIFPTFTSSIFYGEDVVINLMYLQHVKSVIMNDVAIYYHISDSSTSGSVTNKSYRKFQDIDNLYQLVKIQKDNSQLISKSTFNLFIQVYLSNIAQAAGDLYTLGISKTEIATHLNSLCIIKETLYKIKPNNKKIFLYLVLAS